MPYESAESPLPRDVDLLSVHMPLYREKKMNTFHYCFLEHNDINESAEVLSLAMLNNPMHVAVFGGNGEQERCEIENMFMELFSKKLGIVVLAKEGKKIVGVMRMNSCVGKTANSESEEPRGSEEESSTRKSLWLSEWAIRDPKEQHWHLGPIGVLPSHRRLGVGSSLMEQFCREVDKCSATAYLETDLDENVRFYGKFGFEVISTSHIFHVENRYMTREPKSIVRDD